MSARLTKSACSAFAIGVALLTAKPAMAQNKKVITISEITITGRVQKPVAAVDISRIALKLSLSELRQPFLDRIEQALQKEPFLDLLGTQ